MTDLSLWLFVLSYCVVKRDRGTAILADVAAVIGGEDHRRTLVTHSYNTPLCGIGIQSREAPKKRGRTWTILQVSRRRHCYPIGNAMPQGAQKPDGYVGSGSRLCKKTQRRTFTAVCYHIAIFSRGQIALCRSGQYNSRINDRMSSLSAGQIPHSRVVTISPMRQYGRDAYHHPRLVTLVAMALGRQIRDMLPSKIPDILGGALLLAFATWNFYRKRTGVSNRQSLPALRCAEQAAVGMGECLFLAGTLSINKRSGPSGVSEAGEHDNTGERENGIATHWIA
jgi:hypothetical protein